MNFNPNIIALHGINNILKKEPFIKKVINKWEDDGKSLSCYNGLRPSIPSTHFPSFEIEVSNVQSEWATQRSQRHHATFRCMITVSCSSNLDAREEYITKLASCITSIFQAPSNLRFSLWDKTLTDSDYRIDCYDSFVSNVTYNSTRDGTIGVAEFSWVTHCDEIINDGEFYLSAGQASGLIAPFQKQVK
jgi:hypothetical protein